jgi:hypothetical protein
MILGRWDRRRDLNPEVSWGQARVLLGRGLVVRVEGEYSPTTDVLFSPGHTRVRVNSGAAPRRRAIWLGPVAR